MKKAYLVVGPESSGTRFVTGLLIDAGCFGDDELEQRLDKKEDQSRAILEESLLPQDETPIVWRRSFPHGGQWVDLSKPIAQLRARGYAVWAVVTTRDWFPMIQSQRERHSHVTNAEVGLSNVRNAYRKIFESLGSDVPFVMASYDSITHHQWKAIRRLLEALQLIKPQSVDVIIDGNAKWYEK